MKPVLQSLHKRLAVFEKKLKAKLNLNSNDIDTDAAVGAAASATSTASCATTVKTILSRLEAK